MNSIPNLGAHGFVPMKSEGKGWHIIAAFIIAFAILSGFLLYLSESEKTKREEEERQRLADLNKNASSQTPEPPYLSVR